MIIYKATNLRNNKSYIGATILSLKDRKSRHIRSAKSQQVKIEGEFYKDLIEDEFEWSILDKSSNIEDLRELEKIYIKKYKPNIYNKTNGGEGLYEASDDLRRIRSINSSGKNNPMYNTVSPLAGTTFSDSHKRKISEALKGSYRPHVIGGNNPSAKKVKNLTTGITYGTLKEAYQDYKDKNCRPTFVKKIKESSSNGTVAYGELWKLL